jgi:hypothetical protein
MNQRSATLLAVFIAAFLFLATSFNRIGRSGDCGDLAAALDQPVTAIGSELERISPEPTKDDQRGLKELAASLEQLATTLDGLRLTDEQRARARDIATVARGLHESLITIVRGITTEQPDIAKSGAKDVAEQRARFVDAIHKAAESCE